MRHFHSATAAALFAGTIFSQPANADVTAEQVWDSILTYASIYGEKITGTPSKSGETLTISDSVVSMETPDMKLNAPVGDIALTENGDGTVTINFPDEMTATVSTSNQGATVDMAVQMHGTDMDIVASGSPGDITFNYTAPLLGIDFNDLKVNDEPQDVKVAMTVAETIGKYTFTQGGTTADLKSNLSATGLALAVTAKGTKDNPAQVDLTTQIADIKGTSQSTLPMNMATSDLASMLKSGMQAGGTFSFGASNLAMNIVEGGDTMQINGSATGGAIAVSMSPEALVYDVRKTGSEITVSGSKIPFPQVSAQVADSAFRLKLPIAPSDTPADFSLLSSLKGVTVDDMIWGMFDPTGALPHDPANVVVDLSGKATLNTYLLDPAAIEASGEVPGEVNALNVDDLELSVAGASLTGNGAFTIDNTDTATYGVPKPVGTMNLKLTGGNGLMDKLIAMGLLPEDQATGFRMMLGLFARPGEGDDTLVSEITATEDGQILANGQRLK